MRKAKVLVRKGKRYVRTDPFQRALNLARKKLDKAENDLAAARAKIEGLEQDIPGLQSVIAGLEDYFGMDKSFSSLADSDYDATRFYPKPHSEEVSQPARQPDIQQAKKPRKGKPGTPRLFNCNKCGAFTAVTEGPEVCSKCGSSDIAEKTVAAPSRAQPNGAGISTAQVALTPAGDDDQLLIDDITGVQAKP